MSNFYEATLSIDGQASLFYFYADSLELARDHVRHALSGPEDTGKIRIVSVRRIGVQRKDGTVRQDAGSRPVFSLETAVRNAGCVLPVGEAVS